MTQVGFGVVGLGAIARVHIGAIQKAPEARLVAVASRDAGKAAAYGMDFGSSLKKDSRFEAPIMTPTA